MLVNVVLVIFFVWIIFLTVLLLKLRNHYYNLISKTKKEKLDDILDLLISTDKRNETEINQLKHDLANQIKESKFHIQKMGLVRFNPFDRIGGEQSFVIALTDRENNGITLNFIYTKEGLRVYTKRVKKGKGDEYELSEEEVKAIEKAS
ncbi:MAG: hypothetical protein UR68_C0003G0029 [Candidatus Roizmanbacteria bacterium GW2011_GWA2_35_19]|uniref:DUF4446 domain-containing protein n=2 Tax=Candidatus Roizmaniibacteriota TaxID=1752723 RepID=A0A0G0BWN7_9BACT|nr:MAG: hypothetical protein UR63_C0023G0013 [Candidatus Roizmanbacteria bacterium GW2011_GWC2_35_12]KKP73734.1 MAG: hypothetical protein UR68_C0003G0029 [Candidatus Roizmanbacteria bacterium GW2011_GWA2_35_19]